MAMAARIMYPTASSGGASSPLTTKGDLWTYSTLDARLAVGTNGYPLVSASGATPGVAWGTASDTVLAGKIAVGDGLLATPSLIFASSVGTGFYYGSSCLRANVNAFGQYLWSLDAGGGTECRGSMRTFAAGNTGSVAIGGASDVNTGWIFPAGDQCSQVTGGTIGYKQALVAAVLQSHFAGGTLVNTTATGGQDVTNSVTDTASTAGTIPDITNGTVYATDYTNLRNALYQIARMLKQDHDQLRALGLLT